MSSEASRLAVSIGGVEERVSSEAKLVQQERAALEKHKRRLQAGKVRVSVFRLSLSRAARVQQRYSGHMLWSGAVCLVARAQTAVRRVLRVYALRPS